MQNPDRPRPTSNVPSSHSDRAARGWGERLRRSRAIWAQHTERLARRATPHPRMDPKQRPSESGCRNVPRLTSPYSQLQPPLLAGCLTLGLFLALPYVHVVDPPTEFALPLIAMERTDWPTPPPLPLPEREAPDPETTPLISPEWIPPQAPVTPLKAVLDFDLGLTDVGGNFALNFSVDAASGFAALEGAIFEASDVDAIPQPLVQLRPIYPAQARMRHLEGEVVVEFVVSPEGRPESISILSSEPGSVFCNAAVRAIERWRFSPGMRGGNPVTVRVRQRIRFQLEE